MNADKVREVLALYQRKFEELVFQNNNFLIMNYRKRMATFWLIATECWMKLRFSFRKKEWRRFSGGSALFRVVSGELVYTP
mgnify:CR=1 FL=1